MSEHHGESVRDDSGENALPSEKLRRIVIGLHPETEQTDIWTTDLSIHDPGDGYFEVYVPEALAADLERTEEDWRLAVTAIAEHVQFDRTYGHLPICDDYDGQAHEWNGRKNWDDCWRCGHQREDHVDG